MTLMSPWCLGSDRAYFSLISVYQNEWHSRHLIQDPAGAIFKRFTRRIGIKIESHTYSSKEKAMYELDAMLEKGVPVGMLSSVFYLTYLPDAYRFHFNAHNIVVYGKEGNDYLVSDPVMDYVTTIASEDLVRARFAMGVPAPKGKMYYPIELPGEYNIEQAIWLGIKRAGFDIAEMPVPIFGAKGMRYMANRLRTWPEKLGSKKSIQYLGNVVRMQEEIGTVARVSGSFMQLFWTKQARSCRMTNYTTCLNNSLLPAINGAILPITPDVYARAGSQTYCHLQSSQTSLCSALTRKPEYSADYIKLPENTTSASFIHKN